jgi:hypothetical protein
MDSREDFVSVMRRKPISAFAVSAGWTTPENLPECPGQITPGQRMQRIS